MQHPRLNAGPHISSGEKVRSGLKDTDARMTWIGRVSQVNPENNSMYVEFRDGLGPQKDIQVTYPYAGPMAGIRVMPEIGSLGLFLRDKLRNTYTPIAWYPPDAVSAPKYNMIANLPNGVGDESMDITSRRPYRWRTLLPGDVNLGSSKGADLYLDNDAELCDEQGNTYRLRSGDGSSITTSQQNYLFANGVWRSAGFIQRNSLITEQGGEQIPGLDAYRFTHSDGTEAVYLGGQYKVGNKLFSEYRIEVEDSAELDKQINDVNDLSNVTSRNPAIIFALANWVGNDPKDIGTYGKFLAPDLFADDDIRKGYLSFSPLVNGAGVDAYRQKGVAFGLHTPGKFLLASDKEGRLHQYLGASTGDGAGRSLDLVAAGGRWESWGKTADEGLSWKTVLKGGTHTEIGVSNNNDSRNQLARSIVLRTQGQVYHEYGAKYNPNQLENFTGTGTFMSRPTLQGYGYIRRVSGNERFETDGDTEVITKGGYRVKISGQRESRIGGSYVETVIGDKSSILNSTYSLNVTKEFKVYTASRTEKIVLGDDSKTVLAGSRKTDILLGNYETSIKAGNHNTSIGVGSRTLDIKAGNDSTSILAGDFSVGVTVGGISLSTAAGTVSIAGTSVDISGAAGVNISGLLVNLGGGSMSGVLTSLNHPCFVTGAIAPGSFRVFATNVV